MEKDTKAVVSTVMCYSVSYLRMSSSQRRSAKASPKSASCTMSMILPQLKLLCLSTNLLSFSKVELSGWPCGSGVQQARHCRNSSACRGLYKHNCLWLKSPYVMCQVTESRADSLVNCKHTGWGVGVPHKPVCRTQLAGNTAVCKPTYHI